MKKDTETVYVYIGDGLGIGGLPHRVTRAEAIQMQAEKELDAAIEAGVYVIEKEK
jgi:hypothetical protein